MSNCKVIALTNQKGGVGKTTTAVNLGVSLVQQGKKVLLIDADAQANLTMALGYNRPDDIPITLSTVMQNIIDDKTLDASQGIIHYREGVDLLPSNIELSGFEVRLINAMSRERVLKIYVNEVKKNYDYVLIDCMPSLGMITINALAAADSVIIPTQPHYLSAKGLELLLRSVSMVKRQINPKLRIDGILMTMVMPRTNISKEITATVKSAYGKKIKVFDTEIPHSIRAVEATAEGKSIFAYDKSGKVAAAYEQLGKEVAEIGEKQRNQNRADRIWEEHADTKATQLVFCDLSTPKNDGTFNVYDDMREKLIARGIPAEQIRFIHEATTDAQKKELFGKVRSGEVRVLFGSTPKMGAGTNVQDRLIAIHNLDCPWRPSDLEQRQGRIERQGNMFPEVEVYRYVTEQTFDAYLYQLVESKQKFISQIMTSKSPVRSAEDVDEVALSFAEVKMLATGDARFKEKMDLDIQVSKLRVLKQSYLSEHYDLEDRVLKYYPQTIKEYEERIAGYENDAALAEQHKPQGEDKFCSMTLKGVTYTEKADAGEMLLAICKDYPMSAPTEIGSYRGFRMEIYYDTVNAHYCMNLCGKAKHKVDLGADALGNLTRIENELSKLPARLEAAKTKKAETIAQLETAKEEIKKSFAFEDELKEKTERLNALNIELNLNEKDTSVMDTEPEQAEEQPERKCASRER